MCGITRFDLENQALERQKIEILKKIFIELEKINKHFEKSEGEEK